MNLHIPYDQILRALYCAIAMFLILRWNPSPLGLSRVNPICNLKPQFLEKECTALEVKSFCQLFTSYVLDGFQGKPRKDAIYIHLQPLLDPTWWASIVQRGVKEKKSLEGITNIIEAESEARHPLHARRMELLRVKKSGSHSDYLYSLEQ